MTETKLQHDYQWELVTETFNAHSWFSGIAPDGTRGIAVCDDSGPTPSEADHGVIWLDVDNVVLIEDATYPERTHEEARSNCYSCCHVTNLRGTDNDGNSVKIGGSSGREIYALVRDLGITAGFIDSRGSTYSIRP